jgi:ferric-dicitrate binding protein FerR (iron transport regulator)
MKDDFKTLFWKWRNLTATDEEIQILSSMWKSGEHTRELENLVSEESTSDEFEEEVTEDRVNRNFAAVRAQIASLPAKEVSRPRIRRFAVAAAFILGLSVVGFWAIMFSNNATETIVDSEHLVSYADRQYVKLPDGTSITLNEGSTLSYKSEDFGKVTREVFLTGEAFFDVAHSPSKKFIVHTDKVQTTVLGTAFNVNAREGRIVVTVVRGRVTVGVAEREFEQLTPNEELSVDARTLSFNKSEVKSEQVIAWKADFLIMDSVTMKEAARIISEKYNVKVVLGDSSLNDCTITVFFVKGDETLEQVLRAVSLVKGGDYTLSRDKATINGTCE